MDIDRFIARFIPIIGAVLFVIGLGYLIYTSVWLTIAYEAKIGVGLFASLLLIGAGYSLRERMKFYADVTIGAGVLLFYGTLVYASRTTSVAEALLPEHAGLAVSLLFTAAMAYFASERRSREILVLCMLGAYLTPFVIGQEDSWRYEIPYNVYLLYFFAVNLGIFALSRRLWIGDVVPLNGLGLLVGTTSLHALASYHEASLGFTQKIDPAYFATAPSFGGDIASGLICVAIVGVYVGAMTLSGDRFPERYRQFFSFGYVLPFLWFALNESFLDFSRETAYFSGSVVDSGNLAGQVSAVLYAAVALIYFGCWYAARSRAEQAAGRAFLYAGAVASLCLAILRLFSDSGLYAGLAICAASLLLWGLSAYEPARERVAAYLSLGIIGLLIIGFSPDTLADSKALTVLVGSLPLVLSWLLLARVSEPDMREALRVSGVVSTFVAFCAAVSWAVQWDIPFALVLWTLPGVAGLSYLFAQRAGLSAKTLENGMVLGLLLVVAGYFITFFRLVDRLYPFPSEIGFFNDTALIGALSAAGFLLAAAIRRHMRTSDPEMKPSYPLALAAYSALLLTLHHQALALMNDLAVNLSQSARAALVTPIWVAVAAWMMFTGIKNGNSHRPEKLLGVLLLGLTLLKILFFDLDGATTQVRIAVLMVVGGGLMAFSYALSRRGYLDPDAPETEDGPVDSPRA